MYETLGTVAAPMGAMLAQLDLDGFFTSDTFLATLAQFVSSILVQLLNAILFGGSAVLGG